MGHIHQNHFINTLYSQYKKSIYLLKYGSIYPRIYYFNQNKKIVYVCNPKVANNSIKATLFDGQLNLEITNGDIFDDLDSVMRNNDQQCMGRLSKEKTEWFRFSIVRNPYARLVSCYENKYHKDAKNLEEKQRLFYNYLFGYMRKDEGFDVFVKKVVRIPSSLLEPHIAIQSQLIGNIDYFGKIENISDDFKRIQDAYGLKSLMHFNNTKNTYGKSDWRDYYTLETAWLVYNKYREDFERFGYTDSYKELVEYITKFKKRESNNE